MYFKGRQDYFASTNNMFDLLTFVFYIGSYTLKYYVLNLVRYSHSLIEHDEFWDRVQHLNATDYKSQEEIFSTLYWLNIGE
jgi:hypothetical protein